MVCDKPFHRVLHDSADGESAVVGGLCELLAENVCHRSYEAGACAVVLADVAYEEGAERRHQQVVDVSDAGFVVTIL